MYHKIIVPLDGSQLAESALPYATEMAGRMDLDIILFRAYSTTGPGTASDCDEYLLRTAERISRAAREIQSHTDPKSKAVEVKPVTREGYPPEEIIQGIREYGADLVVMATHGYSGLRGWVMGSVADKVTRKSAVPVFLVRAGAPPTLSYQNLLALPILVPLDGTKSSEAVLPHVVALTLQGKGEKMSVRLLRIVEPVWDTTDFPEAGIAVSAESLHQARERQRVDAQDYISRIERQLETEGINVNSEVRLGQAAHEILASAREHPTGLIVMAACGLSGTCDWDLGGNANKVLNASKNPMLIVRPS